METSKNNPWAGMKPNGSQFFFEKLWGESWTYIKTVVDVVREPVLVLDKDLCVLAANEPFYKTFKVTPEDTENRLVYELGNGQWDIHSLKKLLEDILPEDSFFKGFEVAHDFPSIGRKLMILNARRIYKNTPATEKFPPIILLAIEDITQMVEVAEKLADHRKQFETKLTERTQKLEIHIGQLEDEIDALKRKSLQY